MKKQLQKILPRPIYSIGKSLYRNVFFRIQIISAYVYDYKLYTRHSGTFNRIDAERLMGFIIREYHVIEKGLTMPEPKPGFGQLLMMELIGHINQYLENYGIEDEQIRHAIQVVLEYEGFQQQLNAPLLPRTVTAMESLKNNVARFHLNASAQIEISRDAYFKQSLSRFDLFANSRYSVRNYSDKEIPMERLLSALEIAKKTPSACNRQTWRTYVFSDKEQIKTILEKQGGNRGFGHLSDKLIVVTAQLKVFAMHFERNQAYIDGGMYAMSILYALHYNQIACCILNCSHAPKKDKRIREVCKIDDSEVFIAMISCGIPPDNFKVNISKRYNINRTTHTNQY